MKRIGIAFCIAALLILVNASVWEGAASAAVGSDLPGTGYFAATNSFPRNTVVDVTNLENGRTIRVIVAQGLDTPGLLVILSKDAAEAIALPTRSIGRVRMNQPADPVAFSRFTEGLSASGDPDHDPEALIAAGGGINPDLLAEATEAAAKAASEPAAEAAAAAVKPEPIKPELSDAPVIAVIPEDTFTPDEAWSAEDSLPLDDAIIPEPAAELVWTYPEEPEAAAPVTAAPKTAEPEIVVPETIAPIVAAVPEYTAPPAASALPDDPAAPASTLNPEAYEFALAPAEERIPVETVTIDPADMVAQIAPPSPVPERVYTIDPYYIIDPVREAPPAVEIPMEPDPSHILAQPDPVYPSYTPPVIPGQNFSVPVIASLEKGKYYIQVAALSKPETVESEINKIGRAWPMAVQNTGSSDKPVYRVLIGPVNLGESGALLQRFKTNYKDAFVRLGS
jgi:hypothetical protein